MEKPITLTIKSDLKAAAHIHIMKYVNGKSTLHMRDQILYVTHVAKKPGFKQYFKRQFYLLCKLNETYSGAQFSSLENYFHIHRI